MARARIYIRRSDDDQSTWSPEAQEREDRQWCASRGHEIAGVYIDDDLSGKREDRTQFQQLLADAKADPGSILVVHKFDRLARDTEAILRIIYKELLRKRVCVYSVSEDFDIYTPYGKAMLSVSATFSTYYVDNLATEVSKGLREKFEQGGWVGPLPLGYESKFERDAKGERIKGTGRAVFSSDAPTARLVFELYATGNHSDLSIAEELNSRGLTALHKGVRVPFSKFTIASILTNPFYIGKVKYKGQERDGVHEALIDHNLWDRCQAIRARRSHQNGGRLPVRGMGALLSELVYCGRCGARMHTQMCGEGRSRQRYYRCSARRRFGITACDAEFVPADAIESQVLGVLRTLSLPPTVRDAVIAVVQKRIARPTTPVARSIGKLEAQLARIKDLYELGDLERADYLKRRTDLQRQLAQITPAPSRVLDLERATLFLSDMAALLDAANVAQQRALMQQVMTMIWIEKGAVTAIRPAHSYALLVEAMWSKRSRLGSNQQPSAPEADALSN